MLVQKPFVRIALVPILLFFFLLSASMSSQVVASTPAPTPTAIYSSWTGNFSIKPSIPFVWVRTNPSSYAGVITTLYPPSVVIATTNPSQGALLWDGVQWWGLVNLPMTAITG